MGVKLALCLIPYKHVLFRPLGIFKLGGMDDAGYALSVFQNHRRHSGVSLLGAALLEIGPGDSAATGLIAWAAGAKKTVLLDQGGHAVRDMAFYKRLARELAGSGFTRAERLLACRSFEELLQATGTTYLTGGIASLRSLESGSLDFSFSQDVLEHIHLNEIGSFLRELCRAHKRGSFTSHRIDLQDHLGEGLNSLRFGPRVWESALFKRAGFYTNRLRAGQVVEMFQSAGFRVVSAEEEKWDDLPINPEKMHQSFQSMPRENLLVRRLYLLGQKD